MEVNRGDLITIALPGDYGKPRPALVVQSDAFRTESVTVLRLTSDLHTAPLIRITVAPTVENGLARPSQIMVDKAVSVPRAKIGQRIGRVYPATMHEVDRALARFLGLAFG
jgi:mRNA interferase MazF